MCVRVCVCVRTSLHLTLLILAAVSGGFSCVLEAKSKQVCVVLMFEGDDGGFEDLGHLLQLHLIVRQVGEELVPDWKCLLGEEEDNMQVCSPL